MELIGISDTRQPQKTNQRSCDGLGGVLRAASHYAATNKCLARSNKSRTGSNATKKRPAARRNLLWASAVGMTRCGVSTAGLSSPFGGTSRAEAEHELAQPRPVFGPLPACRSRDVAGYHLRMHLKAETDPVEEGQAARRTPARSSVVIGAEHAEKPLTTQAHTRRGSAA